MVTTDSQTIRPNYYKRPCSPKTAHALRVLSPLIDPKQPDCFEQIKPLVHNAYLYNAAKYLWRCEYKEAFEKDLKKAITYLKFWLHGYQNMEFTSHSVMESKVMDCLQIVEGILSNES